MRSPYRPKRLFHKVIADCRVLIAIAAYAAIFVPLLALNIWPLIAGFAFGWPPASAFGLWMLWGLTVFLFIMMRLHPWLERIRKRLFKWGGRIRG